MRRWILAAFCLFVFLPGPVFAAEEKGIVIAAFGSTRPEARNSLIEFSKKVAEAFPDAKVSLAFTSRKTLGAASKDGAPVVSLASALSNMADQGLKKVFIMPLHIFSGQEYSDTLDIADSFQGMPKGLEQIEVLPPLLGGGDFLPDVARALKNSVQLKKGEAVVFVGSGGQHPGNMAYAALQFFLWKEGPEYLVGLVEGEPGPGMVADSLKKLNAKSVILVPLMASAGMHVYDDMAGEANSYSARLKKLGFKVTPVMRGLVENKEIADLLIERLKEAIASSAGQ